MKVVRGLQSVSPVSTPKKEQHFSHYYKYVSGIIRDTSIAVSS